MAMKRVKKKNYKKIILISLITIVLILLLIKAFFFLENMIYVNNFESWPGDCGQFVIWEALGYYNESYYLHDILLELALEENPFALMTGPITIKNALKDYDIESRIYNNFSIEQIKQKLDEKKPVIVIVNVNNTGIASGLTHYLFVFDYAEENNTLKGFYFTDAYYFPQSGFNWSRPMYFNVSELEEKRQNNLNNKQFVGKIEKFIGLDRFVIVVGDSGKENLNTLAKIALYIQYFAEKIVLGVGKVVMFFSGKV